MLLGFKMAERFLKSIDASRNTPFENVLFALGIRYVGETTAKVIARHFGNVDAIAAASLEELRETEDVGDVIAESVFNFFRNEANINDIARLRAAGIHLAAERAETAGDALDGKVIVITGTYSVPRDRMKKIIEENGGKSSSSISSKTSFVLAGEKPGPEKMKKAEELGVKVISEEEFMAMIHPAQNPVQNSEQNGEPAPAESQAVTQQEKIYKIGEQMSLFGDEE